MTRSGTAALKPVRLKVWPDRDSETVLNVLREARRGARRAKARAIFCVMLSDDGAFSSWHFGDTTWTGARLLGEIEIMKVALVDRIRSMREP